MLLYRNYKIRKVFHLYMQLKSLQLHNAPSFEINWYNSNLFPHDCKSAGDWNPTRDLLILHAEINQVPYYIPIVKSLRSSILRSFLVNDKQF